MDKNTNSKKKRHIKTLFRYIVNQVKIQAHNNINGEDISHVKPPLSIIPFVLELNIVSNCSHHFLTKYFERELNNYELFLLLQRPFISLNEKIELRLFIYQRNIFAKKLF